jgi:NhaP-type Na+/H+ and K+/H+ antiporter
MVAVCIFGIPLIMAVRLSGLARRSILSLAVLLVGLGIALGIAIPWLVVRLEHSRFFAAAHIYEPLHAFAVGLMVLARASLTHANEFLAAFAAGITMATAGPQLQEAFHEFGEIVTELLKLAALLVFGALISFNSLTGNLSLNGYLFAIMVLFVVRPLALGLALHGSALNWRERVAAAWFAPKGFAWSLSPLLWRSSGPCYSALCRHAVCSRLFGLGQEGMLFIRRELPIL